MISWTTTSYCSRVFGKEVKINNKLQVNPAVRSAMEHRASRRKASTQPLALAHRRRVCVHRGFTTDCQRCTFLRFPPQSRIVTCTLSWCLALALCVAHVRRAFSLRITEFSKLLRMFPLRVLVPVAAQLDLRLASSGRPEQACSLSSNRALQDCGLSGASLKRYDSSGLEIECWGPSLAR